jgi:hypothetical protein
VGRFAIKLPIAYVVEKLKSFPSTSLPAGLSVMFLVRRKKEHLLSISECLDLRIGASGVYQHSGAEI